MSIYQFLAYLGLLASLLIAPRDLASAAAFGALLNEAVNVHITSIAWSSDGTRISNANSTGYIEIRDSLSGDILVAFQGHDGIVTAISWSSDSSSIVTASPTDKFQRVWNSSSGELIGEILDERYYEGVAFATWQPDTKIFVAVAGITDGGSQLHFWAAENQTFDLLPASYNVSAYDVQWSPDGRKLAVADYRGIFLFDDFASDSMEPYVIPFRAFSIAWSPDGTRLAANDVQRGMIAILDVNSGEVLTEIQSPPRTDDNGVASLAWTKDGLALIADQFDGNIQVWNPITGDLIQSLSLSPRKGSRFLMSVSPFGGRLALTSANSDSQEAESSIQIIVPAPSIERLNIIAQRCIATDSQREFTLASGIDTLPDFVAQVEALPESQIPPGCRADLLAVAGALAP